MKSQRIFYLDIIRIIACIFVVVMHAPIPGECSSIVLCCDSFLTSPCIGLFFMVSGALLLPVKMSMRDFFTKRFKKILFPMLIWSLFYILFNAVNKGLPISYVIHSVFSIPFSPQGNGVLWFMYVLAGLYLVSPIISPWLEKCSKREIELFLLCWGITLLYPLLSYFVSVQNGVTGILYYYQGYIGYFLLGYYLHKYKPNIPGIIIFLLFFFPLSIAVFVKANNISVNFYKFFWYLSVFSVMMATGWFILIRNILEGGGKKEKKEMED